MDKRQKFLAALKELCDRYNFWIRGATICDPEGPCKLYDNVRINEPKFENHTEHRIDAALDCKKLELFKRTTKRGDQNESK